MKITQVNTRYVVETADGKVHVLNQHSLRWNLKHVFGKSMTEIAIILGELSVNGVCELAA